MKRCLWIPALAASVLAGLSSQAAAQGTATNEATQPRAGGRGAAASQDSSVREESSVTEHSIRINGQIIPYKATAGTIQIKNEAGEPIGLMYPGAYTESRLNKTDMVFRDAMGSAYSQVVGKGKPADFNGIDEDMDSFGQFINTYISRNERWNSPKFLMGESYGTSRSAALGNYLQNRYS